MSYWVQFRGSKSSATQGSLPTTHASWPGPISNASPGRTVISWPSALHIANCPDRTYPMWAAESLPVCRPTCRDHRHPGRYSPRPIATDLRTTAARSLPSRNVHDLSAWSRLFAIGFMHSLYRSRGILSEIEIFRQLRNVRAGLIFFFCRPKKTANTISRPKQAQQSRRRFDLALTLAQTARSMPPRREWRTSKHSPCAVVQWATSQSRYTPGICR